MRARPTRTAGLALGAALAAALPAVAAPAADAAPTRTARAFVAAFTTATSEARAAVPAVAPAVERLAPCVELALGAPEREADHAVVVALTAAVSDGVVAPLLPVLTRLQAALDAIPTQDAALRSVRALWRKQLADLRAFPSGAQLCEQLTAWRAGGWKRAARPQLPPVLEAQTPEAELLAAERKLDRAARRLRALGAARTDAARVDGDRLVAPVADAHEKALERVLPDDGRYTVDVEEIERFNRR